MRVRGPEASEKREYFPETQAIIDSLTENPTLAFECIHGGEPAVEIAEVPEGCVAFPGVQTQALCGQHVLTDGSFEGMHTVVDLSIDAAWSKRMDVQSDYCIARNPATGELRLVPFDEFNAIAAGGENT